MRAQTKDECLQTPLTHVDEMPAIILGLAVIGISAVVLSVHIPSLNA